MLCLGIESSCDDTGMALVRDGEVVDSILHSQAQSHAIFGGVVPELASREHYRHITELYDQLLERNNYQARDVDIIAVARGPGLLGSLLVGVAFAKSLAFALQKPLIGINHLQAHLLAADLCQKLQYPCLGLVISGGHTELYRLDSPFHMTRLGRCLDDAAGEALDKAGSAIGLPYPAGKAISDLAAQGNSLAYTLPVPYLKNDNLDFSFSGLKTAAIALAKTIGLENGANRQHLSDYCASLNLALALAVREKCKRALDSEKDISLLCAAGGVAGNDMLAGLLDGLMRERGGRFQRPAPELCMDNGIMIAYAGYVLYEGGFRHDKNFEAIPRGMPIPDDLHMECK